MSNSLLFTLIFVGFVLLKTLSAWWLAFRQMRHVSQHRGQVPVAFSQQISLADHQKAADYTCAKLRLAILELPMNVAVLLGFTLFGGLDWLNQLMLQNFGPGMVSALALFLALGLISGLLDLPLAWYRQFRLEAEFGFNRMHLGLFVRDLLQSALLSAALGLPLLWVILSLMGSLGKHWWWAAWLVWSGFSLLMLVVYPSWIAPLFNTFKPLEHPELRARIQQLLQRSGFTSSGVFVMDGSKRSSHGNAYFTGLGRHKRIVFFDTLLERLQPAEIEAVLAHELGHYQHRHIQKRILLSLLLSLGMFYGLGWCMQQSWFYSGLGVTPVWPDVATSAGQTNLHALALILFFLVLPVFTFFFGPLASLFSRQHEFEADAFACQQANGNDLIRALLKLYQDNAATLTPDPMYSAVYDSHPPAPIRIAQLEKQIDRAAPAHA